MRLDRNQDTCEGQYMDFWGEEDGRTRNRERSCTRVHNWGTRWSPHGIGAIHAAAISRCSSCGSYYDPRLHSTVSPQPSTTKRGNLLQQLLSSRPSTAAPRTHTATDAETSTASPPNPLQGLLSDYPFRAVSRPQTQSSPLWSDHAPYNSGLTHIQVNLYICIYLYIHHNRHRIRSWEGSNSRTVLCPV